MLQDLEKELDNASKDFWFKKQELDAENTKNLNKLGEQFRVRKQKVFDYCRTQKEVHISPLFCAFLESERTYIHRNMNNRDKNEDLNDLYVGDYFGCKVFRKISK